jgi:hypothetical protein
MGRKQNAGGGGQGRRQLQDKLGGDCIENLALDDISPLKASMASTRTQRGRSMKDRAQIFFRIAGLQHSRRCRGGLWLGADHGAAGSGRLTTSIGVANIIYTIRDVAS